MVMVTVMVMVKRARAPHKLFCPIKSMIVMVGNMMMKMMMIISPHKLFCPIEKNNGDDDDGDGDSDGDDYGDGDGADLTS